ncbi:hypothetical protein pneo_cds_24 [Pandoravirus neocaledonia]|uniref:Uncharacterized protein n=1 Tax=Pandoravirus neocaledonia TaxID=2107708 RepID=A0A2U7UB00_9VIRU|nr:hypothetical protein pneo_cds_24 [Pandoravirus neocaledonia]AVK75631.1 hypothetical protein pneo_cds_24 [Pandoravirus neocaledonia]
MPREPTHTPPRRGVSRAKPVESTALLMSPSRTLGRPGTTRPVFRIAKVGPPRESNLRSGPLAARRRSVRVAKAHPRAAPTERLVPQDAAATVDDPLPFAGGRDADGDDTSEYDSVWDDLDDDDGDDDDGDDDNAPGKCSGIASRDRMVETIDDDDGAGTDAPHRQIRCQRRVERAPLSFSLVLPCNPLK